MCIFGGDEMFFHKLTLAAIQHIMLKTLFLIMATVSIDFSFGQVQGNHLQGDSLIKQQILLLDKKIQQAVVIGDTLLIDTAVAPNFSFTHGLLEGDVDTKATWRAFAKVSPKTFFSRDVDSAVVEIHGDVAMVCGRLNVKANFEKDNKLHTVCYSLHYVHLYQRTNNRWVFTSHRTAKMVVPEYRCE